jgi:hypothetical protein
MLATMLSVALAGSLPAPATSPTDPPPASPCWVEPLELEAHEMLMVGRVASEVAKNHCLERSGAEYQRHFVRSRAVARTHLTRFRLFGEELGLDLEASVKPGGTQPDFFYVAPALDLPESWDRAIDAASTPILVVGSAALITTVILQLAK